MVDYRISKKNFMASYEIFMLIILYIIHILDSMSRIYDYTAQNTTCGISITHSEPNYITSIYTLNKQLIPKV